MKEKIDKSIMKDDAAWLQGLSSDLFNIHASSPCLKRGIIWWDMASYVKFMTKTARKSYIEKIKRFNSFLLEYSKLPLNEDGRKNLLSCLLYLDKILEDDDAICFRACEYIDDIFIQDPSQLNRRSINIRKEERIAYITTLDDVLDLAWLDEMNDDLQAISEGAIFLLKGMTSYVNVSDINFMTKSARKSYIKRIAKFSYFLKNFDKPNQDNIKKQKLYSCLEYLNKIIKKDDAVRFRTCTYIAYFLLMVKPILHNCIFSK